MIATMHYKVKPDEESQKSFPLREVVRSRVNNFYKSALKEKLKPHDVYRLIMEETEWPMIEATMEFTGHNQSRAARILGLNRGTFRKKLAKYNMLNNEKNNIVLR